MKLDEYVFAKETPVGQTPGKKEETLVTYDVIVVGGGIAGAVAAIASAP